MAIQRLQKLLAQAGFGSRRACEDIVTAGRVTVDGQAVTELGSKADLATQDVRIDNQRLVAEPHEYWILNKPKNVVCTNLDPAGRERAIDLMKEVTPARLFPVGRLDADSKGLLIMTNDGDFSNTLTHPRYGVPKTYVATVSGELTGDDMKRLVRGVWLAEGRTTGARVHKIKGGRSKSLVEITLSEGRNRQVRRMLAKLGHNVRELVRTRVGTISLHSLKLGQARRLTPEEVAYLRTLPDMEAPKRRPKRTLAERRAAEAGGEAQPQAEAGAVREFRPSEPDRGRRFPSKRPTGDRPFRGERPSGDRSRSKTGGRTERPREGAGRAEQPREGGRPARDVRYNPKERRPPSHWRPLGGPTQGAGRDKPPTYDKRYPPAPPREYDEDEDRPAKGDPSHPFMANQPAQPPAARPDRAKPYEGRPASSRFGDKRSPRGKFDKDGPPRKDFGRSGPPRQKFDKDRPPHRDFGKSGPPRRDSGEGRPPRREFGKSGPPRSGSGEGRPPRRDFGKGGPPRREFGKSGPPRSGSGEGRPPRRDFGKGGPPRRESGEGRPPRKDFGTGGPPRREFDRGGPARGVDRGKRSFGKHDADGTGKAREGDRRRPGRGPGGRPGGRGGPPRSGGRPGRNPPK
jgi:23S rRNA pseudouridine2605 synthase